MIICAVALLSFWVLLIPAYPVWLRWFRRLPETKPTLNREAYPRVDIIVAVRNESEHISGKIANLLELEYPIGQVKFWVVDGASSDGTPDLAKRMTSRDARFQVLRLPIANKSAQLNAALRLCQGDWVLITDADARLGSETLLKMVAAGEAERDVAVVGTPVNEIHAHPLDRLHWRISDRLRMEESARGFASIVTAPCYLFRRNLFDCFPTDGFADDVFTAFSAAAAGRRVRYVETPTAELRAPLDFSSLVRHKRRKVHNYLLEIFRVFPKVGRMRSPARWIFLAHAAQMTLAPLLFVSSLLLFTSWFIAVGRTMLTPSFSLFVGAAFAVVAWLMRKRSLPIVFGVTMTWVLLSALVSYPIIRRAGVPHGWRLPEPAQGEGGNSEVCASALAKNEEPSDVQSS